jgi:hypothetical protein
VRDNQGKYKLIAAKSFKVKFAVLLAPAASPPTGNGG